MSKAGQGSSQQEEPRPRDKPRDKKRQVDCMNLSATIVRRWRIPARHFPNSPIFHTRRCGWTDHSFSPELWVYSQSHLTKIICTICDHPATGTGQPGVEFACQSLLSSGRRARDEKVSETVSRSAAGRPVCLSSSSPWPTINIYKTVTGMSLMRARQASLRVVLPCGTRIMKLKVPRIRGHDSENAGVERLLQNPRVSTAR